ncbi:UDP-N-acetylmuramoyl-L-alanyl-D-glutamate--2,6-diaminopimelate ligase [Legionella hackeliae]|uniref:UDP-N-acetylmuramoyl-L-alanyl-D-glutamate--2,6-diaminopimelate ligase n=1 Tax=Legionella hackeliae TaxID=449 RepID=A0A0A8UR63_LEGHA|nr:UDP-N-acetylmuramoyl-L-alanyl-D-glutamate--2,6-diaminopimelate ligase [Legionella hackeliae]KTD15417.1 UDP-N-acetylmuramoylalanyl-D-glutamate-2, 6-diaminopimelate ligase [Legionella hackeliae]CEK11213.1 UDP-N-acetylmuramoyl-L-alanyl-D-glutamate--2, 6-diaminopimelate ligase [Legionella hackeliae]STX47979.1 UDP-N-acetylmuramoylalanyl-D-glutamate-2, 6-diaminopimelate ligase [Legionella hackeliae]
MKLAELMHPWADITPPDCDILGLHNDSRQIKPGFLFFAYPGAQTDGRLFIPQAAAAGATALVYEPAGWSRDQLPSHLICIPLSNLAEKLGDIASRFYGYPTKALAVTGVTGTNGKTTIAYQLAQAYELLGQQSAYIGTIGQGKITALEMLGNTTPDALCLQQLLAEYQNDSIKQVCMEVSSHALCQHRVDGIDFHQAIFTNLSHEHLDYHVTMEAYAEAKTLLFAKPTLKWAIVNQDDAYQHVMQNAITTSSCQVVSYGIKEAADVRALNLNLSLAGTSFDVVSPWGKVQLKINALGFFNIYNALAIFSSLAANGYPVETIASIMAKLRAAPGRMEIVSQEPYTIVDYAHTPDALENVLVTLNKVKTNRIFVVFGCGGDRDKTKRPIMGKIAEQYGDMVIITSDNPRTEDPLTIIEEIEAGITNRSTVVKIADREQAIAKALSLAEKNDIIVVAGKGHEDYQQIGNIRHPFSDQLVIRQLINKQPG